MNPMTERKMLKTEINKSVDLNNKKMLSIDNFDISVKIGTGSYAVVKLAIDKTTG
jgi:hypothetical protein